MSVTSCNEPILGGIYVTALSMELLVLYRNARPISAERLYFIGQIEQKLSTMYHLRGNQGNRIRGIHIMRKKLKLSGYKSY